jgi:hypothetical protein
MNKDKIEELNKDLEEASSLEALAISDGGKILLKNLAVDIISNIEILSEKYPTMTIQEFISLGASTKEKMIVFKAIHNSKKNKTFLKEVLQETLNQ